MNTDAHGSNRVARWPRATDAAWWTDVVAVGTACLTTESVCIGVHSWFNGLFRIRVHSSLSASFVVP